jgi:hypothetical protein
MPASHSLTTTRAAPLNFSQRAAADDKRVLQLIVYRAFYLARLRIWERQVPPSSPAYDIVGIRANFVEGDVTRLRDVVQGTFNLVLDFGCLHMLPPRVRTSVELALSIAL